MTTLLQKTHGMLRGDLPPVLTTIGGVQVISIEPGHAVR
jgi:hypothetical protein